MTTMSTRASILQAAFAAGAALCAVSAVTPQEQVFPRLANVGGVYEVEHYPALAPARTRKAVLDVTQSDSHQGVHKGLQHAGRLMNLYALAGVAQGQVSVAVVVHGDATSLVLNDEAYSREFGTNNPNREAIKELAAAGVDLKICGQALHEHGWSPRDLASDVTLELSAMTALVELQLDGYALVP